MKHKDRGNWQKLSVQWRVALRVSKRDYNRMSEEDRERMRLTALVETLETGVTPSWARISYIAWQNPDEEHEPAPLLEESEIIEALATLNRGQWLVYRIRNKLDRLGGSLTPSAWGTTKKKVISHAGKPSSRRPAKKGKARRKVAHMAHVRGRARKSRRKVQKVGRHRRAT